MLFNSFEFAIFLPIVFIVYWFVVNRNLKLQNLFIVAVSYLFYGWWDWRFLLLIAFTTVCSYVSGLLIEKYRKRSDTIHEGNKKGKLLTIAKLVSIANIVVNLLVLCVFKYFNFFSENLSNLFDIFGFHLDWVTIDVLLPVGISFYTFQALSYTIDVYKQKIQPTRDPVAFFAFVSFFPQLVAGPIERATNLLPQFYVARRFDYGLAVDGCRQMLWGFFKKIVIADNCSMFVDAIFSDYGNLGAGTLTIGIVLFAFQIFCDFSGYSDIAIGTARLFGISLMRNFNFPYFSRDIAEFWRRWHISLTTWFRDYIYFPLGGSRCGKVITFRNTLIIFLVSGFWHGANWTFVAWGAFHAMMFLPLMLLGKNRTHTGSVAEKGWLPSPKEALQIVSTFILACIGWVFFRSDSISDAWNYLAIIFTQGDWSLSYFTVSNPQLLAFAVTVFSIVLLILGDWYAMKKSYDFFKCKRIVIVLMVLLILLTGAFKNQLSFIYFQF